ncbi:MAG: signal peptide peptidase SppA, partial [Nitrospirota bacterium]
MSVHPFSSRLRLLYLALLLLATPGCSLPTSLLSGGRMPLEETTLEGEGRDKILLLDISGLITSQETSSGLIFPQTEPSVVDKVKEMLKKAEGDDRVKAVVLRINSPGGTVTASDIIYQELIGFKERAKRPLIVSIVDLGTSGAYYIAQSADRIFAHPTAVTGSIGVIMVQTNIAGLLEKVGVQTTEIKSGEKKFMGSPFRPMAPEEQAIFQKVITSMHQQFLAVVAKGRPNLPQKELVAAADGRIYTAQQAKELGL